MPNNGLTSFLAGERGAGGHVVISKRRRQEKGRRGKKNKQEKGERGEGTT